MTTQDDIETIRHALGTVNGDVFTNALEALDRLSDRLSQSGWTIIKTEPKGPTDAN